MIERHLEHAAFRCGEQDARRALEAQALDEPEERLAGDGAKDAVEVKRRERRDADEAGRGREPPAAAEGLGYVSWFNVHEVSSPWRRRKTLPTRPQRPPALTESQEPCHGVERR